MKIYYCICTLLAVITMILGAAISSDVMAGESAAGIEIANFKFDPGEKTVAVGQDVVWKNLDGSTHTVLIDGKESPRLKKGDDYRQVFSKPGRYAYQCGLHSSMKGVVNVSDAAAVKSAGLIVPAPSSPKAMPAVPTVIASSASSGIQKVAGPGPTPVPHADSATEAPNVVSIVDFMRFSPAVLTVKAGTTVTWNNYDGSNHIIVFGNVRSPRLKHDSSFSYEFNKPGEYSYICGIHGEKMSGKIIVM
ncbi:cupredoxin domain-containing protein [Zhongshania aquimaris]|uniref:Cupredoxin domain-containing protein n=1 Tax=Zhongshania aquimaris TaxID=2857107 RepID=A0ABS6VWD5_9GAMM|nr:cupredoxin domain-containing protein [Zhongshania aquimaris]MBW2942308.1 cupredoxin domain-containing protein [Zhongshania aquimaris]